MLEVGDIVRLINYPDEPEFYGFIQEIRNGRYYNYNIIIVFFDDQEHHAHYNEADLLKVSNE
jgi:hypothetical protein